MAEEAQPKPEEVVVVEETKNQEPPAEPAADAGDLPATDTAEQAEVEQTLEPTEAEQTLEPAEAELEAAIPQSASFKEESNVVADLPDPEKKALDELKQLVTAALKNNEFKPPPPPSPSEESKAAAEEPKTERVTLADELIKVEEKNEEPKIEEVIVTPATDEVRTEVPVTPATEDEKREILPVPAAAEEIKEEVLTAPAAEKEKKQEPLTAQLPAPAGAEETPKPAEEVKSGEVSGTPAEEAPVPVVEETRIEGPITTAVADEKTVEAIEEPVIPASEETPAKEVTGDGAEPAAAEEFIWGVPLLGDDKSDTVLLKFLRAREFKVKEAFTMLKNTHLWRKSFRIESLLDENLDLHEMNKVVFMHGHDKEGHPVCYNVFGEFQDKELYGKAFGDEEKRKKFMRWRIQVLEKGIRQQLDFTPGGVCTMVQVNDLKNSPLLAKRELRQTTNQALALLQDNYPEFVAKQVFINVPWWYVAYNRVISPFLTQRTKSKFVFASSSKSADTLFKYIAPEQVPVQYGGLSKENDTDFTTSDAVTEITIKPSSKQSIEVPVTEHPCVLVWELRVLGWEVTYGAEFVPSEENGYTVIVQKARKFASTDEPVLRNSFKICEPGKILLTIDNNTSKKKKLLYRSMAKSSTNSI